MSIITSTDAESLKLNLIGKISESTPQNNLPSSLSHLSDELNNYGIINLEVDNLLTNALYQLSKNSSISLTAIFIAGFNIILQRYTGQEHVLLGQAFIKNDAINDNAHVEIGGIWNEFNSCACFETLAGAVDESITSGAEFIKLDVDSPAPILLPDVISPELLQIFFIAEKGTEHQVAGGSLNAERIIKQLSAQFNNFYFGLCFKDNGENVSISLFYNKSRFNDQFFALFNNRLLNLLNALSKEPGLKSGAYNILGQVELNALLNKFNDTVTDYPREKALFELFEEQAFSNPENIALIKGGKQLAYGELNRQSNRLAHALINWGVKPGDNIGLLVNRDFEMIIGMLGILKAGGAYVPIDPDYPLERQEYIYNQSSLKMVVADDNYPLKSLIHEENYTLIDALKLDALSDLNPALKIDSKQLAYTIYTSGSTGRPKGVMIAHHSAVNLVLWVNDRFKIGAKDRLLFITSMCFDLSVYDIFGMLAAGGALVIAEKDEIQNVQTLAEMLSVHQITFWDSVPTTMDYLVRTLETDNTSYCYPGLKTVFMSGDWIPVNLPEKIGKFFPQTEVVSLGGATEGTVWSNFFIVNQTDPAWSSIPYGRPISNNFFYILNDHLMPVPVGTIGDLYIGGVGVASGYAGDAGKTAQSFIPDPFHPNSGGMMYRTGDLGRMMPDYNMEFIGRKDNQVKIQGFRVELGEIESVLNHSELVSSAVVLAKNDKEGKKYLTAYVVYSGSKTDQDLLTAYLRKILPDYMVPAVWITLDRLPLTSNGKIDRNALPDVENFQQVKREYMKPETETESMLLNIWKEHFKRIDIDVESNFFEIGGHSLMAVQILSKLKKISGKNFQLSILYKYPAVRSLARFIDKETSDYNFKSLVPIKPSGSKIPLYIIHGDGLNVLNFSQLATSVDKEQPVYALQALGLNGIDEPIDSLPVIAYHYMQEIIQHNSQGPYLLAGYSSGGYVAMEIRKQMVAKGMQVKMLIIFDTDAEKTEYKDWYSLLPKKAKRHFPRMVQALKFSLNQFFKGQQLQHPAPMEKKKDSKDFYKLVQKIKSKHITAFRNYHLEPFDDKLYLYKAKISVHYVEYGRFLGWEKYAMKGVALFEIPGDHFSMLTAPHVTDFGSILQQNIDEVTSSGNY